MPVVTAVAEQPPSWLCFNGHGVTSHLTPAPASMDFNASSLLYPSVSWLPVDGPQGSFILWGGFDWRRSSCVPSSIVSHLRSERTTNIVPAAPTAAQQALAPSALSRSQSLDVPKPKFDPKTVEILQPTEMRAAALAMGASFTLRAQTENQNANIRPLMKKVASIDPSLLAAESTAQVCFLCLACLVNIARLTRFPNLVGPTSCEENHF